ncbi:MAG: DUF4160 domain-containing protein [Trichlorobacter sp.]|jgi:hypothetical protein|nr:DUF4160 domain-containing protein [Trichlorobacter sp.]
MPIISCFFGIVVTMRHNDHPPAHFHAAYQGFEATIAIKDGSVMHGRLPRTAARIVKEWTLTHQTELINNWNLAQALMPLVMIKGADND